MLTEREGGESMLPLSMSQPGEENIIRRVGGSPEVKKHLKDLGFVAGGKVTVINALGGNIQNAYGIPVEQLIEVSHLGIGKINVDTDIRLAVTRNIREFFVNNPSYRSDEHIGPIWELMEKNRAAFDPRVFLPPVMDTVMYGNVPSESVQILTDLIRKGVMEVVGTLIVQFGSVGKAGLVEVKSLDEMAEFYRKKD